MERPAAFEEKIDLLKGSLKRAEEIQKQIEKLSSAIYSNFQIKVSGDAQELVKDIKSLYNFYVLLKKNERFGIGGISSGYFSLLPPELVLQIFSFLPPMTLLTCMGVNWEFKRFSEENSLWKDICLRNKFEVFWIHRTEPNWKSVWKWYTECQVPLEDYHLRLMEQCKSIILRGQRTGPDGAVFKGEWKNGMKDGKGIQTWPDADVYKGEWKCNKRTGFGIHIWPDGHYYEGYYDDDKRNGEGVFRWPDGREYRGSYVDDQRNGKGEFRWPNGDKYIGMYKNSNRNGYGVFEWFDGRKYEGYWENGGYHGRGTYTHRDKCKYEGEWKDNLRNGKGKFTWSDNDFYEGDWVDGKRFGKGKFTRTGSKGIFLFTVDQEWREDKFDKHSKGISLDSEDDVKVEVGTKRKIKDSENKDNTSSSKRIKRSKVKSSKDFE